MEGKKLKQVLELINANVDLSKKRKKMYKFIVLEICGKR